MKGVHATISAPANETGYSAHPAQVGLAPRLIERLNAGLNRKLGLIFAPTGFGKTTLVSEWVDHLRLDFANENQSAYSIAWLSLDEHDDDLIVF